jgi:hypothetical protein
VLISLLWFGGFETLTRRTAELSDSRRQERWSARGAPELPPGFERRSGAAVRSSDFVGRPHGAFVTES